MTRESYEKARRIAVEKYLADAYGDYIDSVQKGSMIKTANAERRIKRYYDIIDEWKKEGFWTKERENIYMMCYEHLPEDSVVSAL